MSCKCRSWSVCLFLYSFPIDDCSLELLHSCVIRALFTPWNSFELSKTHSYNIIFKMLPMHYSLPKPLPQYLWQFSEQDWIACIHFCVNCFYWEIIICLWQCMTWMFYVFLVASLCFSHFWCIWSLRKFYGGPRLNLRNTFWERWRAETTCESGSLLPGLEVVLLKGLSVVLVSLSNAVRHLFVLVKIFIKDENIGTNAMQWTQTFS